MTVALSFLVIVMFAGAVRIAASWLANIDDTDRERSLEQRMVARYRQPVNRRTWLEPDSISTAAHAADLTTRRSGYGAWAAVDPPAHAAARSSLRAVAHAGSTSTPLNARERSGVDVQALNT